jgi:glycerophosphoryl diester phosphodiesterase
MKKKITLATVALASSIPFVASLSSCSKEGVRYIAHRGAPGVNGGNSELFENTKETYEASAKNNKFFGLETDIFLMNCESDDTLPTSDYKFLCVHDDTCFDDGSGQRDTVTYINQLTYNAALLKPIVPSHGYPYFGENSSVVRQVMEFSDYLDICKQYNKVAIIEIKEPSHLSSTYLPKENSGYMLPDG